MFYLLCRFNLYKENKDTQEALGVIGKMLGIQVPQKTFNFYLLLAENTKEFVGLDKPTCSIVAFGC